MFIIDTTAALRRALDSPIHPALKGLLALRHDQLVTDGITDLAEVARFLCVLPGDTLADVEQAFGFPITDNEAPFEWCLNHGLLFEAPTITSDDGYAVTLLVMDYPGVDPVLLDVLRQHAAQVQRTTLP